MLIIGTAGGRRKKASAPLRGALTFFRCTSYDRGLMRGSCSEDRYYFRLPLSQIAYARFIVESYEGLAQVTSLPGRGEMEWIVPLGMVALADALARALGHEVGLVAIPRPEDWPESISSRGMSLNRRASRTRQPTPLRAGAFLAGSRDE